MTTITPMGRLPALFVGRRRRMVVLVVLAGLVQAVAGAGAALLAPHILSAPTAQERAGVAGVLAVTALAIGLATWGGRLVSEQLAQHYVHRVRLDLVRSALTGESTTSLGITVARTTNDLTAVRNWIVLGIVPLLTAAPILLGALVGLGLLHPWLAVAAAIPIVVLLIGHVLLAPAAFARARAVRRQRGRLAGHITDTVVAGDAIRRAGGIQREVSAVAERSSALVDRAVDRAKVTGAMRALAAGVAAFAITSVAWVGATAGVAPTTITSAFMLVGMLSVPLADLGRLAELRQGFLAAEVIIVPQLELARSYRDAERRRSDDHHAKDLLARGLSPDPGPVHVTDLDLGRGPVEFLARPGDRLVVSETDRRAVTGLVEALTGDESTAWVNVAGYRLPDLPSRARRLLVGLADDQVALEQGTIARAVRYRVPDATDEVGPLLAAVGLGDLSHLERRERTKLRRGGEPLTAPERARVHLARSLYGTPPLVVLDRIDHALAGGAAGTLRDALADYPGVVIIVPSDPAAHDALLATVPGARPLDLVPAPLDGQRPRVRRSQDVRTLDR